MENLYEDSAIAFVSICPLCDKAYARGSLRSHRPLAFWSLNLSSESSYNRHVKYCQRAQNRRKGRPKSCTACNLSKAKCSFRKPQCLRCETKGLHCVYKHLEPGTTVARRPHERGLQSTNDRGVHHEFDMNVEQVSNWTGDLPLESLPLDLEPPALEFDQGQLIQFDISNQDPKTWDSNPLQSPPTAPAVDTGQWQAYCESSTPAITFPPGDMISRLVPTTTVTHLRFGSVALKHATVLISNILSAFPQMMLRRQTFPPFVHGHWHTSSLPEKLASCMSISQLFSTRASETQAFLWRTIQAEDQRFRDEVRA